jgi:hypothetical protein
LICQDRVFAGFGLFIFEKAYLERKPIYDMAGTLQALVLVARARIHVDANAREMARQRLCSDSDAIIERRHFVKFDRVLFFIPPLTPKLVSLGWGSLA